MFRLLSTAFKGIDEFRHRANPPMAISNLVNLKV
jgi:hypothetical protein